MIASKLALIVEDNERSPKLMRDVLQFMGYETIEAETGEERLDGAQPRSRREGRRGWGHIGNPG
jgi:CheY-like chemotaxis protein